MSRSMIFLVFQGCIVDHGTLKFCTVIKGHIVSVLPADGVVLLVAAVSVSVISEDLIHENAQLHKAAVMRPRSRSVAMRPGHDLSLSAYKRDLVTNEKV